MRSRASALRASAKPVKRQAAKPAVKPGKGAKAARPAKAAKAAKPAIELAIALKKDARYVDGRRAFFKYRDLGVTEATRGRMRAQVTTTTEGMTRATGWHYHLCEMQFVYMLGGWVDLEIEGRGAVRLQTGDSIMIPGGCRHQEVRTSDDFEILEVSLPADMGTEPCEAPAPAR